MESNVKRCVLRLAVAAGCLGMVGTVSAFDQSDIDAATAGGTLMVPCAGSPHVQVADLNIDKTLTIVGEAGCATPSGKPTIEFNDECHEVNILADDVILDDLRFEKTTTASCAAQGADSYIIVMLSTFANPITIVPYGNLTVTDSILVGSRRSMRISSTGDVTILRNEFSGNSRDVIFVANLRDRAGTSPVFEFSDNMIDGWGGKVVLVESGPSQDRVTGSIVVSNNIADGLTTSPNFFVYNNWNGSPAESATYPVDLTVTANEIRNLSSNAIVIFFPIDFAKLADLGHDADSLSINLSDNDVFDAGRGIILDYTYLNPSGSIPATGQVVVENNVLCRFSSSDLDLSIPVAGSGIASDLKAIGVKLPIAGLTSDAFGLADGSFGTDPVSAANFGCDGRPAAVLDHFQCYEARPPRSAASPVSRVVTLSDQFEDRDGVVGRAIAMCNPVDKNGEGIDDPTAHLSCHALLDTPRAEPFTAVTVLVENQFGATVLEVDDPGSTLCLPSEKNGVESPLALDHFLCYPVQQPLAAGAASSANSVGIVVDLVDQFGPSRATVKEPVSLCNPVDKNGEGILSPDQHLVCYRIERTLGPTHLDIDVLMTNQFGNQPLEVRRPSTLCVPSTKTVLPAP